MNAAQEIADIDRLIEEARRDLLNGRYEARDTVRRLQADRQRANARALAELRA